MNKKRENLFSHLSVLFISVCTIFLILISVYGAYLHHQEQANELKTSVSEKKHFFSID
jgi:hypothetical protein